MGRLNERFAGEFRGELGQAVPTPYNQEKESLNKLSDQCASRERLEAIIERQAEHLDYEAKKLHNLSRLVAILPDEVEQALYPIISESLYKNRNF